MNSFQHLLFSSNKKGWCVTKTAKAPKQSWKSTWIWEPSLDPNCRMHCSQQTPNVRPQGGKSWAGVSSIRVCIKAWAIFWKELRFGTTSECAMMMEVPAAPPRRNLLTQTGHYQEKDKQRNQHKWGKIGLLRSTQGHHKHVYFRGTSFVRHAGLETSWTQ